MPKSCTVCYMVRVKDCSCRWIVNDIVQDFDKQIFNIFRSVLMAAVRLLDFEVSFISNWICVGMVCSLNHWFLIIAPRKYATLSFGMMLLLSNKEFNRLSMSFWSWKYLWEQWRTSIWNPSCAEQFSSFLIIFKCHLARSIYAKELFLMND